MNTEEYINKRLEELRQAAVAVERELFAIRAAIGELEAALNPIEEPEEPEIQPE